MQLLLARRIIADHRVDVTVDQARREGHALGVDQRVGPFAIDVALTSDASDLAVQANYAIGVQYRLL